MVKCVKGRTPLGAPWDSIDYRGAVAIFAFRGEESEGRLSVVKVVIFVFGENKALYYHQKLVKGLGWDVLAYGECLEDTVEGALETLRLYERKAREGAYKLVDKRVKPGYEELFKEALTPSSK